MFQATARTLTLAIALFASAPLFAQQQSSPAPASRPYTINAGDELEIYVWGEERLQRSIRVLPDGTFAFPLVGQVQAQGKLPAEIEKAITQGLSTQYRGEVPQVTVSVRNPSGLVFSILGKVRSPGVFTPGRYVNVLEAIGMAGGPNEFANLDNVTVVRNTPKGNNVFRVKLGGAMKGAVGDREIPQIESGDTVIVP